MEALNDRGELPGAGPDWACDRFGLPDHDYCTCQECQDRFQLYMNAKASIRKAA